jgi:hypothetical protein
MTKLEKALEDMEAVKRVFIKVLCPVDFGMENNCKMSNDCEDRWNEEVEE